MVGAVRNLPPQIADGVLSSIAFVGSPQIARLGPAGHALVTQAKNAFVAGVGGAVLVGAVVLVVTATAVFLLAPSRDEAREDRVAAAAEAA